MLIALRAFRAGALRAGALRAGALRAGALRAGAREALLGLVVLGLSEGLGAIERGCAVGVVLLFVREELSFLAFLPDFAALERAGTDWRGRCVLAALDAAFEPLDFAAGAFARDGGRREVRMREVMFRRKRSAIREAL